MAISYPNSRSVRLGVVMTRSPGVTRWAKWSWKATAVFPGAGEADWKLLRSAGDVSDTEEYVHELETDTPSVYVVLRPDPDVEPSGLEVVQVTASPYEAQDYCDSGEEVVEKVPMPAAILAEVQAFVAEHHVEEPFVKRRRNKHRTDRKDDGVGDARISQATDVYRAPTAARHEAAE